GSGRPPPAGAGLQRDGPQRRAEGADRDRSRPSGFGFGRLAQPGNRGDAGRLGRGQRLAAAERAAEHRIRGNLGVAAPWRRRRHGLFAAFGHGDLLRRHGRCRPSPCPGAVERPRNRRDASRRRGLSDRAGLRPRTRAEPARDPVTCARAAVYRRRGLRQTAPAIIRRFSHRERNTVTLTESIKAALRGLTALTLAVPAMADQLADVKAAGKIVTATAMHSAPCDVFADGAYQGMTKDLFDG